MNPRWFRYCLLAAALAVALWRLPAAPSSDPAGIGLTDADVSGVDPGQAPPAVVAEAGGTHTPSPR